MSDAEDRVAEQIAAATARREQQALVRAEFNERRQYGLRARHAARLARLRLAAAHAEPEPPGGDAA